MEKMSWYVSSGVKDRSRLTQRLDRRKLVSQRVFLKKATDQNKDDKLASFPSD